MVQKSINYIKSNQIILHYTIVTTQPNFNLTQLRSRLDTIIKPNPPSHHTAWRQPDLRLTSDFVQDNKPCSGGGVFDNIQELYETRNIRDIRNTKLSRMSRLSRIRLLRRWCLFCIILLGLTVSKQF